MGLYLDIETTYQGELTVVGLHHASTGTVQLVAPDITAAALEAVLPPAICVYTYNGDRFDLPIIKQQVGIDLKQRYRSVDLMKTCHRQRLFGGLKGVEQKLGITRQLEGLSGKDAVALWYLWQRDRDQAALDRLLAYNREDVENLVQLRTCLEQRLTRGASL
ncbi:MAG: ribonuclease H-like domain-containing protein [Candidatus Sericytochromatia bacterium]|nr:ribonuclease H-like domain-containing protein [Candidatus Sericytochromatia bacterium]